jgi:hypothetical protein
MNILYIIDTEDTVGNNRGPLNMEQKVIVAGMKPDDGNQAKGVKKLRHRIELAVGIKVMVTLNLATEADLVNGSRGTIADIVLDLRERLAKDNVDENGIVWLQYLSAMILFKLFHYEFEPFPSLAEGVIPYFHWKYNSMKQSKDSNP